MIFKIISLFLVFMAVLAMFGRLRFPASRRLARCPDCGRPLIGRASCDCKKKG